MNPSSIVLSVALQRYVNAPPVAEQQRHLAMLLAESIGCPVDVVSVEAPVALAPSAETLEQKLDAYVTPMLDRKVQVQQAVLSGRPSDVLFEFLEDKPDAWVVCGSHSKRSIFDIDMGNTAKSLLKSHPGRVLLVKPSAAESARAQDLMIPHYPMVFPYG